MYGSCIPFNAPRISVEAYRVKSIFTYVVRKTGHQLAEVDLDIPLYNAQPGDIIGFGSEDVEVGTADNKTDADVAYTYSVEGGDNIMVDERYYLSDSIEVKRKVLARAVTTRHSQVCAIHSFFMTS